jgi:3'-5' exoribonuclease
MVIPENLPVPHFWIEDLREDDRVCCRYLVKKKSLGTTRKGEPFISITLADRTGEIEAKVWEKALDLSRLFRAGDVIEVEGVASSYRGQIQLTLSLVRVPAGDWDPGLFLEASPRDPSEMMGELRLILKSVKDRHLRSLLEGFLRDRDFMGAFRRAPAAKNFHHNYLGGLLEHTLSVCRLAVEVSNQYPQMDRDLLVTAAFLHDVGKVKELSFGLHIDYTDEGRLLGHLVMGAAMVDDKLSGLHGFPQELAVRLKHLILSHHGEYEFGSPKRPKILEGFALHLVDDLDAKINGLGRFMERDQQEGAWTEFNRMFSRYFLKGILGVVEKAPEEEDGKEERQQGLFQP